MAEFRAARLGELVHPEGLTLLGLAATHLVARSIDAALGLEKSFRRVSDWVHVVILGGSAYLYARGTWTEVTKTAFVADSMLVVSSIADLLYEKTVGPRVRALGKARQKTKVGGGTPSGGGGGAGQITTREQLAQLGPGQVVPGEGIPVFIDEEIAA